MASTKHHYLPQYYLKGFTDSSDGFFIYDKQNDKIFKSAPPASFFENHLNTVTLPDGSHSDFLEAIYTDMENRSWPSLDTIRASTAKTKFELSDKMRYHNESWLHKRARKVRKNQLS